MRPADRRDISIARSEQGADKGNDVVIGSSRQMYLVEREACRISGSNINVLIEGETGVGKTLLAEHIHHIGPRRCMTLVKVNCGAIPDGLFESELFGTRRGAFTGASSDRTGHFEAARGGTIVLEEISEVPHDLQVKLLQVVEEGFFYRLGSEMRTVTDARIIATSNVNLMSLVSKGCFRADLYYRLAKTKIKVPALRERKEDIETLSMYFLRKYGGPEKAFADTALAKLEKHSWPGNVRELETCILRAAELSDGDDTIEATHIEFDGLSQELLAFTTREAFVSALKNCGGSVAKLAGDLGCHRNTIYYYARKLGIDLKEIRDSLLVQKFGSIRKPT